MVSVQGWGHKFWSHNDHISSDGGAHPHAVLNDPDSIALVRLAAGDE